MATPIIIESRYFEEKVKRKGFFQKWNDIEKPKKELAKVQVVQPKGSSWVKLAQVGQVEQVEAGLQIYVGQVGQEQGGLQIDVEQVGQEQGVCPAEPLHLTQMELPGREKLPIYPLVRRLCFPTSNCLDIWLILSGITRSRQYHESTMVFVIAHRAWYFSISLF